MFSYHIDAAYNFSSRKWFQKSSIDLPANAWLNRTGVTPSYPMISDTVMVTGTDIEFLDHIQANSTAIFISASIEYNLLFLKVYFKDKYLVAMESGSNDDQHALAWCQMRNGTMFLSEERLYFR